MTKITDPKHSGHVVFLIGTFLILGLGFVFNTGGLRDSYLTAAVGTKSGTQDRSTQPGGVRDTQKIFRLSSSTPSSAKIGDVVTLSGTNFPVKAGESISIKFWAATNTQSSTTIVGYINNIVATSSTRITFQVPTYLDMCSSFQRCLRYATTTLALGDYNVALVAKAGETNTIPLNIYKPIPITYPYKYIEDGKVQVLVFDDFSKVDSAISKGCTIIADIPNVTMKALRCPPDVAYESGFMVEDGYGSFYSEAQNIRVGADKISIPPTSATGLGRKIVVLDTGYNSSHQELSSSFLMGKDFTTSMPFSDYSTDEEICMFHGTGVSGVITADGVLSQAKGIAPNTGIIIGRVLRPVPNTYDEDRCQTRTSSALSALHWTTNLTNVDAVNLSFGMFVPDATKDLILRDIFGTCDTINDPTVQATRKLFNILRSKGVVPLVAAQNTMIFSPDNVGFPACLDNALVVAGLGQDNKGTISSRYGPSVDIVAPHFDYYIPRNGVNGYATSSKGNSFATPLVAGTIALMREKHPEYTVDQIEEVLFYTASYLDDGTGGFYDYAGRKKNSKYGYGRLNACAAVLYDLNKSYAENYAALENTCYFKEEAIVHFRGGGVSTWEYGTGPNTNTIPVNGNITWTSGVSTPFVIDYDKASRLLTINLNNAGDKVWTLPADIFSATSTGKYKIKIQAQARPINGETAIVADVTNAKAVIETGSTGLLTTSYLNDIIGATTTMQTVSISGVDLKNSFAVLGNIKLTWEPGTASTTPTGSYTQVIVRFLREL